MGGTDGEGSRERVRNRRWQMRKVDQPGRALGVASFRANTHFTRIFI